MAKITRPSPDLFGNKRVFVGQVEFGSTENYVTGGIAVKLQTPNLITVLLESVDGYSFVYNRTSSKVQVFSGIAELADASTALRALKVGFIAIGD